MTVSGTFTLDGTATGGAKITVIDTDASPPSVVGTATTAADGTWSVDVGYTTTVHALLEYTDPNTGEKHNSLSKPFVHHESPTPAYISTKGVFWLKFDEGTGAIEYDDLNTHDADITGAAWSTGTWVGGTTLTYDGLDDVSVVTHSAALDVSNADFSIAATVNIPGTPSTSTYHGIAMKYLLGGSSTPHYGLAQHTAQDAYIFRVRDAGGVEARVEVPISTSSHPLRLVGVRSGNTFSLYANGTLSQSVTATLGDTSNTANMNIGRYWTSDSITGEVDDVILFNAALTDAEITEDYNRQPWSP